MKIVLDTSILISALIRNSVTRKLIIEMDEELVYPEAGIREIKKYKNIIIEKSGLNEKEFNSIFNLLLEYIELVPDNLLERTLKKAKDIMFKIDEKDAIFVATALVFKNAIIWSDDKDFKKQNRVPVKTTSEILKAERYKLWDYRI